MEIKKKVTFRSDLTRIYIKKHYEKTGVLLHFSTLEHDNKYQKVWEKVSKKDKNRYMEMFVKDKEEALNKYLEDANMNNIPMRGFDSAPRYFLNLFKLKSYCLADNCCYYKGMLRDILGVVNSNNVKIKLYCVSNQRMEYLQYLQMPL